ncbi:O-antigen flippase Wzx [Grimontia indica]|uniref:O-antigen flippase Wzx n=1 Tax=Grimontia indica TaxID=1056512 RepID=R1IUT9_9GAMM|nr:hypothetical protein [Grimontia indica]EOD79080.1 O-antigen flippase Wzx [Grimontia indica]
MYLKAIFQILTGSVVSQIVMFLSTFIIGLYYSKQDVGEFALFSSYIAIGCIFTSLRLEQAISKSQSQNEVVSAIDITLTSTAIISLLFGTVIIPIVASQGVTNTSIGIFLLTGTLVLTATNVTNALLVYQHKFKELSYSKIIKSAVFIMTLYPLSLVENGILWSFTLSSSFLVIYSYKKAELGYHLSIQRIKNSLLEIKHYEYIYKYSVPNACLNTFAQQIPIISGAILYSPSVIGVYFFVDKILRTPAAVILQSLRPVLIRFYSNKNSSIRTYYIHSLLLMILGFVYTAIIYIIAYYAFSSSYMEKWQEGIEYIVPVLIIAFSQLTNTASVPFLLVKKKTRSLLYTEISNVALRLMVFIFALNSPTEPSEFFYYMSIISITILTMNVFIVKLSCGPKNE